MSLVVGCPVCSRPVLAAQAFSPGQRVFCTFCGAEFFFEKAVPFSPGTEPPPQGELFPVGGPEKEEIAIGGAAFAASIGQVVGQPQSELGDFQEPTITVGTVATGTEELLNQIPEVAQAAATQLAVAASEMPSVAAEGSPEVAAPPVFGDVPPELPVPTGGEDLGKVTKLTAAGPVLEPSELGEAAIPEIVGPVVPVQELAPPGVVEALAAPEIAGAKAEQSAPEQIGSSQILTQPPALTPTDVALATQPAECATLPPSEVAAGEVFELICPHCGQAFPLADGKILHTEEPLGEEAAQRMAAAFHAKSGTTAGQQSEGKTKGMTEGWAPAIAGDAAGGLSAFSPDQFAFAGVEGTYRPARPVVTPGKIVKELISWVGGGILGLIIAYYILVLIKGDQGNFLKIPLPGISRTYKYSPDWFPRFLRRVDPAEAGTLPPPESELHSLEGARNHEGPRESGRPTESRSKPRKNASTENP